MSAPELEKRILDGLKERMLEPELVETFFEEYQAELRRWQKEASPRHRAAIRERTDLERQIARLVVAIAQGAAKDVAAVGDELRGLEARLAELGVEPDAHHRTIDWHPSAVDLYKRKIADLHAALNADDIVRAETTSILRGLIDKILAYHSEPRASSIWTCTATWRRCSI